jgi:hypothetical protein
MERRRTLLVKGASGLGNRILSVLTGILYARLSDRNLIVDWRDPAYSQRGDNAFPRFFRCPTSMPIETLADTTSVRPMIWGSHLHAPVSLMRRTFPGPDFRDRLAFDLSRIDYDEDVLVMCTFSEGVTFFRSHLDAAFPELRGCSVNEIMAGLLRQDLVLHPDIRARVERVRLAHFTSPTVGIHVRYSDHRGNLSGTRRRLNALLAREPDLRVFLSTDSRLVADLFADAYPSLIPVSRWYPSAGKIAHGGGSGGDRTEHGIEALMDLFLLGACDYLVLDTSSSFARIACLVSRGAPASVFDVTRGPKRRRVILVRLWRLWQWRRARLFHWRFRLLRLRIRLERLLH